MLTGVDGVSIILQAESGPFHRDGTLQYDLKAKVWGRSGTSIGRTIRRRISG